MFIPVICLCSILLLVLWSCSVCVRTPSSDVSYFATCETSRRAPCAAISTHRILMAVVVAASIWRSSETAALAAFIRLIRASVLAMILVMAHERVWAISIVWWPRSHAIVWHVPCFWFSFCCRLHHWCHSRHWYHVRHRCQTARAPNHVVLALILGLLLNMPRLASISRLHRFIVFGSHY